MMRNLTRLGQAYYMGYHEYYDGDYRIALQRAEKGEQITPGDVQRVAGKYLAIPDDHTLVIVK
jgi:predicted Zn-dependent peptidase